MSFLESADNEGEPLITTKTGNFSSTLIFGIIDNVDVIWGVPYEACSTKGSKSGSEKGDLPLEAKWKLYEKDDLSFALNPGFTIPKGGADKDFGAGRLSPPVACHKKDEVLEF